MLKRWILVLAACCAVSLAAGKEAGTPLRYKSAFLRVQLAAEQPAFTVLSVDSLGKGRLEVSPLRKPSATKRYTALRSAKRCEYREVGAPANSPVAWSFEFSERQIRLRSNYSPQDPPPALVLNFNTFLNHTTLLGRMNDDGSVRLPALLHMPDHGTLSITSSASGIALGYDAQRFFTWGANLTYKEGPEAYVKVTIPAATEAHPHIDYTLDVVAIYPHVAGIERDARFDGFRRNWLNIFQLNPRRRILANNAASDPCGLTLFLYSSIAARTPQLAPGLTALDLIRETLDHYLAGTMGYGMASYDAQGNENDSLDTYPSLLMAAADYARTSGDGAWLKQNYPKLKGWAGKMLGHIPPGGALLEDITDGNSGIYSNRPYPNHTSNWWDNTGFGHQDAYANALAYRALQDMAELARRAGEAGDAEDYDARAARLRAAYYDTFYNPATGVLAGWRSRDGHLHDYYFTFVNGVAITHGLIPPEKARAIMDRMLAKMNEVGYKRFEYGLPGNLIPIRQEDYMTHNPRWGSPEKKDGSDGFQVYINGGATACFAYYTLQALYQTEHRKEADEILFGLLRGYEQGGFQGHGSNGMTYDWRAWDGTPHGYEGLLVDNYHALLAVLAR
jgi:hypothetical protein